MPVARDTEENQTPEMSMRSARSRGEDAVPVPSHSARNVPEDFRQVNGWGADLDPANRPSFPKEWPSDVHTARGEVRDWQVPRHKVHVSNEHPNLTPVFGTSAPPHGLSGKLRDYAFEYGEATNRHWMTLMLADRVDIWSSLVVDLFRGRPDNIVREKGWPALMRYSPNRRRNMIIAGATVLGAVAIGSMLASRRS